MQLSRFGLGRGYFVAAAVCSALLGCGGASRTDVELAAGGSAGSVAAAGALGNGDSNGGTAGSGGRAGALLGGAAGALAASGGAELKGDAGEAGAPAAVAALCLYPEQVPDGWQAADPASSDAACAVGVLGEFLFEACVYELLETMAYDVDPFSGGHSHCCYRSRLRACPSQE